MGAAYLAIGLFVSARTDSQIVSLILTTLVCGAFYLVGSATLTELAGNQLGEILRGLGSGSRFESMARGILDVRDLYYYLSLVGVFLALNVYSLERQRWAVDGNRTHHKRWQLGTALLVANLLIANFWLSEFTGLRWDMTRGNIYSISTTSKNTLQQLREPLLIRGYFSAKTHPLLAPLVPQLKDLLKEYEIAGQGKVRVEFIDPVKNPELEDEANSKYGIRPVPFQISDRYQASLVNSYFDVLIQYGDQYEVLSFRDLIEVKVFSESDLDVQLRNPEYDITRSIKHVLQSFQSGGDLFASIQKPIVFTGYLSARNRLPVQLAEAVDVLNKVLADIADEAGEKFKAIFEDPEAGDGKLARQIAEEFGFAPMAASLFDSNTFYFYLTLSNGETSVQIPLPDALSEEAFKKAIESGLKRFASGYIKTVALVAPETPPPYMAQQLAQQGINSRQYTQLADALAENLKVSRSTLSDGKVPDQAEALVVVDAKNLNSKQLFAIDQFLMQGGAVVLSVGAFETQFSRESLSTSRVETGLEDWLHYQGLAIDESLVLDPVNSAFPVPVTRQVGGLSFQEMYMLDYPYFIDVRGEGLSGDSEITADIPQITIPWASPILLDEEKNANRSVSPLLRSSPGSWRSASTDVMPKMDEDGLSAFKPAGETGSNLLGVAVTGRFDSFFNGKTSPLLEAPAAQVDDESADSEEEGDAEAGAGVISGIIEKSPESAKLVLFSSGEFLSDQMLGTIGSASGTLYTNSIQLIANTVDWALEDEGLLQIRSRGHFNRTLPPLDEADQVFWEYLNYLMALFGLIIVYVIFRMTASRTRSMYQSWLSAESNGGVR